MKKDIKDREDIVALIDAFYSKVRKDDVIGFFFNDVAKVDWQKHLPVMYDFWENVLFYTATYDGNPMLVHRALHEKSPMKPEHFQRWNQLFTETVAEMYHGKKAELIKQRALSISNVLQMKIFG